MNRKTFLNTRGTKIHPDVELIIQQTIDEFYFRSEPLSIQSIHELVIERIEGTNKKRDIEEQLRIPSISTIKNRTNIISNQRNGAKKKIDIRKTALYPLQKAWVEHTVLDVMVVDNNKNIPLGKPMLTIIIDEFSEYPLGYHLSFDLPLSDSVMQALRHAMNPKHYMKEKYPTIVSEWEAFGKPEALVVDNGKEFFNDSFFDSCSKLGINIYHRPIEKSENKEKIEGFFRTIVQQLSPVNEMLVSSKNFDNEKYKLNGRTGVIRLNHLHELLHIWFVDIFAQGLYKDIGKTPSKLWNQLKPLQKEFPYESMIALLPKKIGTISSKGIRHLHLFYQSVELQELSLNKLKEKRVEFHFDTNDMSAIYVYDYFQKKFIVVPCENQDYSEGLSEHAHGLILNAFNDD
ncbi:transposase family protein [Metabacillus litoralis]|uniref:transposase family protein n=1 Tax=Metabacillus litoralis TaxID=152268 RepID=UPI0020415914|nr:transposase family protein [Metabacillus litoralis]MCM3412662.1 transposase family protein [Metabacillus litoralis]